MALTQVQKWINEVQLMRKENAALYEQAKMQHEKILELENAAYETGYYAAVMERAILTQADRDKYRKLQAEALARRTNASLALEAGND